MAREALTTTWEEIATTKTAAFVQNVGANVVQLALGSATPSGDAGFVLQKGDYLSLSGVTSSTIYARSVTGVSEIEYVTD